MSEELVEPTSTKPVAEHAWLHNLVGEWRFESEAVMGPDQAPMKSTGRETVKMFGELWAVGEGEGTMPDGSLMFSRNALGFDVSFKEYRGFWMGTPSSHLWKYVGTLSEDGKVMTLDCEGPNMEVDGETANYRDVIELIDPDYRTMTSFWQDADGNWVQFMKAHYRRV